MNMLSSVKGYMANVFDMGGQQTGAVDVVAIQHEASVRTTPFHARFGRLDVPSTDDRRVTLLVNGVAVDHVLLEIDDRGEVYFVDDEPSPSRDSLALELELESLSIDETSPSLVTAMPPFSPLQGPMDDGHMPMTMLDSPDHRLYFDALDNKRSAPNSVEKGGSSFGPNQRNPSVYFDAMERHSLLDADVDDYMAESHDASSSPLEADAPQLSLCGHLLQPSLCADEVAALVAAHAVSAADFRANPLGILQHPHLMVSVHGLVHPYDVFMQAYFVSKVCFPKRIPTSAAAIPSTRDCSSMEEGTRLVRSESDPLRWFQWFAPSDASTASNTSSSVTSSSSSPSRSHASATELAAMGFVYGDNAIEFAVPGAPKRASAVVYFWHASSKLIFVDIDTALRATTKSLYPGVAYFLESVAANGYHVVYTTVVRGRAPPAALPRGPVCAAPLASLLHSLRSLFPSDMSPFYASFGSASTLPLLVQAGVPKGRAFAVEDGRVASARVTSSYERLVEPRVFEAMFPPIYSVAVCKHQTPIQLTPSLSPNSGLLASRCHTRTTGDEAYNDVNFWRVPPSTI
ncbi:hypothetical protein SPRG_07269 [Saprolegnia parasitica CBS 223.65]|uniref:LNS2/PITP domain-containing protein n=1 Tax=Saprolegnia parasitica (strain CBS 223.65) TaxID=695850 RepID=A0A067CN64_SAPPC|nr:hypothetical protein SPRG_07269 [Saprolegnia parasitica CBS 223.65]KDO27991.1 hypothetical protein SPRG_07269 [Saprolegnia parasitica CBS 223.65]|eukprot:XP_012201440.1 hypothetical protein SPRG_07269 [Saprolegnia parasitica CBS 223.65]